MSDRANVLPFVAPAGVAATSAHDGLVVDSLVVEYRGGASPVRPVDGCSFSAKPGSIVLLLGPSGCGKTTILSCLGALLRPTAGQVRLAGTDIGALRGRALTAFRRADVGIVFQAFNLIPSLSARENVAIAMTNAGRGRREALTRAGELLTDLGLGARLDHRPDDLSGGQQQRVAIARAVAMDPLLVLSDEPTAHLDHGSVSQVLDLHRALAADGRVVVVSTHDDRMLQIATEVVELAPRAAVVTPTGPVVLPAGAHLFRQGDRGDLVYVVRSGSVVVERTDPDGSVVTLATRHAGEYVGEMAPMFGLPRSASVRAHSDAIVDGLSPAEFRARFAGRHATPS
jgi:putative ABC transport system ATP-binding protein